MKKQKNRIGKIFLMAFLLAAFWQTGALAANPLAQMPKTSKVVKSAQVGTGCDFFTPVYSKDFVMKAVSSNKKVATVKVYNFGNEEEGYSKGYLVKFKGYGTTNIKVTVKINGKTYKKTCKYTYYKYKNPFSTFKIGNKNFTSTMNKKYEFYTTKAKLSGKLSYKLKSGYKIMYIYARLSDYTMKKMKNGKKLPADTTSLWMSVQNKKTGLNTAIVIRAK